MKASSILSADNVVNLYRGCSHGCIYCDSRSVVYNVTDFDDVSVKEDAILLLRHQLSKRRHKAVVRTGSMNDPYLHLEKSLKLTRGMLQALLDFRFGVSLLTKSDLVLRDIDLLTAIHQHNRAVVAMTLTTASDALAKIIEPHVTRPSARFAALKELKKAGLITGIWLTPLLPEINDTVDNLNAILDKAIEANVDFIITFDFTLTLREGSREYFYKALDVHFKSLKAYYMKTYGMSYLCPSKNVKQLRDVFIKRTQEAHILTSFEEINALITPKKIIQTSLF